MRCDGCTHWAISQKTVYGDGSEIENWAKPSGMGYCASLKHDTEADFGCNRFIAHPSYDHVHIVYKEGAPWQNWQFGPCPDCKGVGCHMVELRPACGHCAGLGKVRYYDDGYIADKSWDHPKEKEIKKLLRDQGITDPATLSDPGLILAQVRKGDGGAFEGGTL
jgi:hypothetical protein